MLLAVNFDHLLRLSANYYLKHYHSELKLEVSALKIEQINPDFITFSDLALTQEKSQLSLSGFQLQLAPEKPYWLSRLILEKGQLLLDIDSLSQLLPKEKSAGTDSSAFYRQLLSIFATLPEIRIKALNTELFSHQKKAADKLLLEDSHLTFTAGTKVSMNLKTDQQDLVSLQSDFEPGAVAGKLTADLGKLNSLVERYFDQPLMITGELSSDFTLVPAAAGWALTSSNQVSNSRLDLSGVTGEAASFVVDGDFILNYRDAALEMITGQDTGLRIKAAADTVKTLKAKLKQQDFGQDIDRLLQENIPQQVFVSPGSTVALDINNQLLSGHLQLYSQLKKGEITIKLPEFTIAEQKQVINWQLDYQQQQPIKQLGKVALSSAGEMSHSPAETKLTIKAGEILLTEIRHQEQKVQQGTFALTKPTLIQLSDGTIQLSDKLFFTSTFEQVEVSQQSFGEIWAEHAVWQAADNFRAESVWRLDDSLSLTSEHLVNNNIVKGRAILDSTPLSELLGRVELPELLTLDGQISNELNYEFELETRALSGKVSGQLVNSFGSYDDIAFSDINAGWSCFWQLAKLSCGQLGLNSGQVNVGVNIADMQSRGTFSWDKNNWLYHLNSFKGKLLDGGFSITPLEVAPGQDISGELILEHISLTELVALQQQPGIEMTGFIDGKLPFSYNADGISINQGKLLNQGGGLIKVDGNPAVEELKQTQPQLKFSLDALKELHYQHLDSEVSMMSDGSTLLKVSVQGKNPELVEPVHFNYQHDENLFLLLRTLRLAERLSENIEKAINK